MNFSEKSVSGSEYLNKVGIHVGHGETSERDVTFPWSTRWQRFNDGARWRGPLLRTIELNFAGFICADRIASTRLFARGLGYIPSGSTLRTFPMTPARRRARRPRYDRYLFIVRICIRDGDLFLFRIISNRSVLPREVLRKQYAWQLIG